MSTETQYKRISDGHYPELGQVCMVRRSVCKDPLKGEYGPINEFFGKFALVEGKPTWGPFFVNNYDHDMLPIDEWKPASLPVGGLKGEDSPATNQPREEIEVTFMNPSDMYLKDTIAGRELCIDLREAFNVLYDHLVSRESGPVEPSPEDILASEGWVGSLQDTVTGTMNYRHKNHPNVLVKRFKDGGALIGTIGADLLDCKPWGETFSGWLKSETARLEGKEPPATSPIQDYYSEGKEPPVSINQPWRSWSEEIKGWMDEVERHKEISAELREQILAQNKKHFEATDAREKKITDLQAHLDDAVSKNAELQSKLRKFENPAPEKSMDMPHSNNTITNEKMDQPPAELEVKTFIVTASPETSQQILEVLNQRNANQADLIHRQDIEIGRLQKEANAQGETIRRMREEIETNRRTIEELTNGHPASETPLFDLVPEGKPVLKGNNEDDEELRKWCYVHAPKTHSVEGRLKDATRVFDWIKNGPSTPDPKEDKSSPSDH